MSQFVQLIDGRANATTIELLGEDSAGGARWKEQPETAQRLRLRKGLAL
jgi:hypothetical protein